MSIKEIWKKWSWVGIPPIFIAVLVFLWVNHAQSQKSDPVVQKIQHAVLYRGKDCIVTRVTVFEPAPWRSAVTEFYVTEGGVNFDRPIPPKCYMRFP